MLFVSTPSPDDPLRYFNLKYLVPYLRGIFVLHTRVNDWSYCSNSRHLLSSRVRLSRSTSSCILQRNCTAQAEYRFCFSFAVHQNPKHIGRQAQAGTHAIREAH